MEKDYLKRDLDDIVFESRNQAYGAYQLRKNYGRNMQKASLFGIAFCGFIMVSPFLMDKLTAKRIKLDHEAVVLTDYVEPPPPATPLPPPPPPPPPPPRTMPTVRFLPPEVTNQVETEPPIPDIPKDIAISTETVQGDTTVRYVAPVDPTPPSPPEPKETPREEPPKVMDFHTVEQKPEFPDGEKAMYRFLGQNIKYPALERENGIEGTVYVGFTIGMDGGIQSVAIRRSPSKGMSDEAMRVVSLMPKWSPGKQNGRPVPVSFTLPLKFKLD
jgi:periplasmic protein TonB